MTNEEYLDQMITLNNELNRASSAEPYDPDAYNDAFMRLNRLVPPWEHGRRRRPWAALLSVIILLIVLLVIVYEILSILWIRGSQ